MLQKTPEVLYKYYPANCESHLVGSRTLRFSSAANLNDINELRWDLNEHFQKFLPVQREKAARDWESNSEINKTSSLDFFFELGGIGSNAESHMCLINQPLHASYILRVGLLCLSANPRSPAMWGHYAENGAGVCVGFSTRAKAIRDSEYGGLWGPGQVVYRKNKLKIDDVEDGSRLVFSALTKGLDWAYEKEFRCIRQLAPDGSPLLVPFRNTDISEIILGPNMSFDEKNRWKELSRQFPKCRLKLALPSLDTFDLHISDFPAMDFLDTVQRLSKFVETVEPFDIDAYEASNKTSKVLSRIALTKFFTDLEDEG